MTSAAAPMITSVTDIGVPSVAPFWAKRVAFEFIVTSDPKKAVAVSKKVSRTIADEKNLAILLKGVLLFIGFSDNAMHLP